jgi:hypothetical protein
MRQPLTRSKRKHRHNVVSSSTTVRKQNSSDPFGLFALLWLDLFLEILYRLPVKSLLVCFQVLEFISFWSQIHQRSPSLVTYQTLPPPHTQVRAPSHRPDLIMVLVLSVCIIFLRRMTKCSCTSVAKEHYIHDLPNTNHKLIKSEISISKF